MSIRLMTTVWDSALESDKKLVLLALADWASDDGENVYPSVKRIAWKTSYSERKVQYILKSLRSSQIIERMGTSKFDTVLYRINADKLPKRPTFVPTPSGRPEIIEDIGGAQYAPIYSEGVHSMHLGGAIHDINGCTVCTQSIIKPSVKPSVNYVEQQKTVAQIDPTSERELAEEQEQQANPISEKPEEAADKPIPLAEEEAHFSALANQTVCEKSHKSNTRGKPNTIPQETLRPFVNVVSEVTGVDRNLNYGRLAKECKDLICAGYTADQVLETYGPGGAWYTHDWRGQKGQKPQVGQIRHTIAELSGKSGEIAITRNEPAGYAGIRDWLASQFPDQLPEEPTIYNPEGVIIDVE